MTKEQFMKATSTNKKDLIFGDKPSLESLYYTALFSLGAIAAMVLICIGKANANKGLTIYAAVLLPIFVIAALVATRSFCVSINTVHKKCDTLVIKTFFMTRKYNVGQIKRFSLTQSKDGTLTEVKMIYRGNAVRHTFKKMTKEEAAHFKRAAHNK